MFSPRLLEPCLKIAGGRGLIDRRMFLSYILFPQVALEFLRGDGNVIRGEPGPSLRESQAWGAVDYSLLRYCAQSTRPAITGRDALFSLRL